jgi:hypothetical protein
MRAVRILLALAALLTGIAGGAPPKLAVAGTQQCYHRQNEPLDGCSICMNTCMGGSYLCCAILPG